MVELYDSAIPRSRPSFHQSAVTPTKSHAKRTISNLCRSSGNRSWFSAAPLPNSLRCPMHFHKLLVVLASAASAWPFGQAISQPMPLTCTPGSEEVVVAPCTGRMLTFPPRVETCVVPPRTPHWFVKALNVPFSMDTGGTGGNMNIQLLQPWPFDPVIAAQKLERLADEAQAGAVTAGDTLRALALQVRSGNVPIQGAQGVKIFTQLQPHPNPLNLCGPGDSRSVCPHTHIPEVAVSFVCLPQ
jgi:hypothetical protein